MVFVRRKGMRVSMWCTGGSFPMISESDREWYLIKGFHGQLVVQAGCQRVLVLQYSVLVQLLQDVRTLLRRAGLPVGHNRHSLSAASGQAGFTACRQVDRRGSMLAGKASQASHCMRLIALWAELL